MNTGFTHELPYRGNTNEWLTPPEIIKSLGPFDLDPCAPINKPWDTAKLHYNINDDGLKQEWVGKVWLNPPYGELTKHWLEKLYKHGNGIALVFARTETKMFQQYVFGKANALFFFAGRISFYLPTGEKSKSPAGSPSVLIAYGENNVDVIRKSGLKGTLILL